MTLDETCPSWRRWTRSALSRSDRGVDARNGGGRQGSRLKRSPDARPVIVVDEVVPLSRRQCQARLVEVGRHHAAAAACRMLPRRPRIDAMLVQRSDLIGGDEPVVLLPC